MCGIATCFCPAGALAALAAGCDRSVRDRETRQAMEDEIVKTDEEWKAQLTPE